MIDNSDDYFGEAPDMAAAKPPVFAVWPARVANGIELHLNVAADIEKMLRAPAIFLDEDGSLSEFSRDEYQKIYGEVLTLDEVCELQTIVTVEITEKFRLPIIIAHELGPTATGADYRLACEVEGVDPITRGY